MPFSQQAIVLVERVRVCRSKFSLLLLSFFHDWFSVCVGVAFLVIMLLPSASLSSSVRSLDILLSPLDNHTTLFTFCLSFDTDFNGVQQYTY